jgi:hypothetical protein
MPHIGINIAKATSFAAHRCRRGQARRRRKINLAISRENEIIASSARIDAIRPATSRNHGGWQPGQHQGDLGESVIVPAAASIAQEIKMRFTANVGAEVAFVAGRANASLLGGDRFIAVSDESRRLEGRIVPNGDDPGPPSVVPDRLAAATDRKLQRCLVSLRR